MTSSVPRIKFIPVSQPVFAGNEKQYVLECLESTWISSSGRFIHTFEEQFAAFCGCAHGVACNNGTAALHLALAALGTGAGDEILMPTLTFVATANAVRYCGATPVFVDSDPLTMCVDPALLASRISPRTKGIIVVHLYGHPADMDPINQIAKQHGLFVVEDAAEAHGALYKGRPAGSLSDAATFSFYGNKIITTGEGGMVTTSDAKLADRLRLLRGQGMDPERRYWFDEVGYNYRMTNVAAAIGLAQFERIADHLGDRTRVASWYDHDLRGLSGYVTLPRAASWASHAYWAYAIVLRDSVRMSRDNLMARLLQDGIETRPVFYPMHVLPPYRCDGSYPVSEALARGGIILPSHGMLTREDTAYIAERLAFHLGSAG